MNRELITNREDLNEALREKRPSGATPGVDDWMGIKGRDPRIFGRAAVEGLKPLRGVRRKPRQLEHLEQVALFEWRAANEHRLPGLEMMYAVPNAGAGAQKGQAGKMKAEGVMSGVPDISLDVARGGFHGLRIELKAPGGTISKEQRSWIEKLNRHGYRAIVCVGWEAARKAIEEYLAL